MSKLFFLVATLTCSIGMSKSGKSEPNLALLKPSKQSSTMWAETNASMATDGDEDTCAVTSRDSGPRWWQVDLGEAARIQTVSVTITPAPDGIQKFTVFVVDVDKEMNHTNFRRCDRFQGFLRPTNANEKSSVQMLHCPGQGAKGRKVFVRDDRMKGIQELKLCEVKVFGIPLERDPKPCPPVALANGETVVLDEGPNKQATASFSCRSGYILWGASQAKCLFDGRWDFDTSPTCNAVSCGAPPEFARAAVTLARDEQSLFDENPIAKTKVEEMRRRRERLSALSSSFPPSSPGDVATYTCRHGTVMIANTSRGLLERSSVDVTCSLDGDWLWEDEEALFECMDRTEALLITEDMFILEPPTSTVSFPSSSTSQPHPTISTSTSSSSSRTLELFLYFLLLLLAILLVAAVVCVFCSGSKCKDRKDKRKRKREEAKVTHPRMVSDGYSGSTTTSLSTGNESHLFLFPNFRAKDLHTNCEELLSPSTSQQQQQQPRPLSSATDVMFVNSNGRAVVADPNLVRTATIGLPMTSFRPKPVEQTNMETGTRIENTAEQSATAMVVTSTDYPSNWSLRRKPAAPPLMVFPPPPPLPLMEPFSPDLDQAPEQLEVPPDFANSAVPEQHHYTNLLDPLVPNYEMEVADVSNNNANGSQQQLPEIDEAGYASLIVNPIRPILSLTNTSNNRPCQDVDYPQANGATDCDAFQGESYYENAPPPPDLLQRSPEALYANEPSPSQAVSAESRSSSSSSNGSSPDTYAKIDRSKKSKSPEKNFGRLSDPSASSSPDGRHHLLDDDQHRLHIGISHC